MGNNVRFGINAGLGYYFGFSSEMRGLAYDAGIIVNFGKKK